MSDYHYEKGVSCVEKTDRNAEVWYVRRTTKRTLKDIGEEYGVTPERVRQIVLKNERRLAAKD